MNKNGKLFISIIGDGDFLSTVWDPYSYRHTGKAKLLSQFANVSKLVGRIPRINFFPFQPIEYKDIPGGAYLSFALRPKAAELTERLPVIGEGQLLFGTMRAYLGNVIVTPQAEWVGQTKPVYFKVKSEFILVSPLDQLHYFWLVYFRSKQFLSRLPLGHGGTRPRLQPEGFSQTPVTVPEFDERKKINDELEKLAKGEWENYFKSAILSSSIVEERAGIQTEWSLPLLEK